MDTARTGLAGSSQPAAISARRAGSELRRPQPPRLEHALGGLWDELRGLLHDQLLLASLEGRQALAGLTRLLVLAVSCAALVLGAWAAATVAVMIWLVDAGLPLALALVIVAGAALLLAAGLTWLARRSMRDIAFPATLRTFAGDPPGRLE